MLDAEEEFLKALASIKSADIKEEYRAYYDSDNHVKFYMANKFPTDDQDWINITREEYVAQDYQWMWVVDGKLVKRLPQYKHYFPLTINDKGVKVVKGHAGLIVEPDESFNNVEFYAARKRNN